MKTRRTPQSKLKGAGLAAFEELQARLKDLPNVLESAGQVRLLEVGIEEFAARIPDVVLQLLDEAAPISVADATVRAGAAGKSWQDVKATLELQVRLVRARARWERGDAKGAGLELVQVSASASSRRAELILREAARLDSHGEPRPGWAATFSLALLRSASGALANSLEAALSLVEAMIGAGEQAAAALVLGQIAAGLDQWPQADRDRFAAQLERLSAQVTAAPL